MKWEIHSALLELLLRASKINKGINQRLQRCISINRMPFTFCLKVITVWVLLSPAVNLFLMRHMFLLPTSFY